MSDTTINHIPFKVELKPNEIGQSNMEFSLYTFLIERGKAKFHAYKRYTRKSQTTAVWRLEEDKFQKGKTPDRYNFITNEWEPIPVPESIQRQVDIILKGFLCSLVGEF